MDKAKIKEIRQWLIKALHDLESAKVLAFGTKDLGDTAVYHCQQVAEKSLKAYLTLQDQPFQKVHDLTLLLSQCEVTGISFEKLRDACEILTPYATMFRYPGNDLNPDKEDVVEAVQLAELIYEFVLKKMPKEIDVGTVF